MLRLIKQKDNVDLYQFENEENDDTRKCIYVDVNWYGSVPHANHPTTMVSVVLEYALKKIGRQNLGDTIDP